MKPTLTLLTALLLAPLAAPHAADLPTQKPNILVILADDLGYADIPAHGGQGLSMPHLDGLTRQGVRFSNAYVTSPQCSPSRCGLLTGIYNQRFGHEHNGCMQAAFNAGAKTIAEHLRPSGYATAAFCKWHLGDDVESHHPTKHGFDEAWGYQEYEEAAKTGKTGFPVALPPAGALHAQAFATRATGFIEAHAAQPWFIYAAFHEPHVQLVPTPESASRAQAASPDPLRRKCLGVLRDLDSGIGIMLAKLRALKLEERTLINLFAVREGGWKLVQSKTPAAQLFNLSTDAGERNDLAAQHPDVVKRLQSAWDEWNATLKPPAIDKTSAKQTRDTP